MSSENVTLNIIGMKCGGCVSAIEEALKSVSGTESVTVSLENNSADISGEMAVDVLIAAVEAAGFKAEQQ